MRREIWQLLDSSGPGGIESHVLTLATCIRDRGYVPRIVLLQDHGPHPLRTEATEAGVQVLTLPAPRDILMRLRSDRPVLLHTHGYKAGIVGRLAARATGTPVVSTHHNGDMGQGLLRLYTVLDRITGPLGEQIAVSEKIATRLMGRVHTIENFVRLPVNTENDIGSNVVAFAGRLSPEKGPDLFCALAERLPSFDFHVFGDGPMRNDLERRYAGLVRFHGMVSDLAARWSSIGLLCMTSRVEGLPMVALEAMAWRVPVAAFSVGGLGGLISDGHSGWLAPPENLTGLHDRIVCHFSQSPEQRTAMSRSARRTIEARYSPETQLEKTLRVYQTALDRPSMSIRRSLMPR